MCSSLNKLVTVVFMVLTESFVWWFTIVNNFYQPVLVVYIYRYLFRVVDLFTFSHVGNWNKQGGHVTLMWLVALSSAISVL